MAGIPGTIAGAVYGNAGSKDKWISEAIESVEIYRNSKKELLVKDNIAFSYRESDLESTENSKSSRSSVITKVNLLLKKALKNNSLIEINKNIQRRLETQPLNMPNAGSIFKNPKGLSIGKLIEEAGLKGESIGGAQISRLHGNFIVNTGDALAKDVLALIDLTKNTIKEKFNIDLETEIKIINELGMRV